MIRPFQWYPGNPAGQRIKYKGAISDGKIGCCCDTPADCCLYPWPDALGTPLYPSSDLPNAITLTYYQLDSFGEPYDIQVFSVPLVGDYEYYLASGIYGDPIHITSDASGFWRVETSPTRFKNVPCLIGVVDAGEPDLYAIIIEDQFASAYSAVYGVYDPITIYRVSLCRWEGEGTGTEDQPYTLAVYYDDVTNKWQVRILIYDITHDDVKDDPQSSPLGYFAGLDVTIS